MWGAGLKGAWSLAGREAPWIRVWGLGSEVYGSQFGVQVWGLRFTGSG